MIQAATNSNRPRQGAVPLDVQPGRELPPDNGAVPRRNGAQQEYLTTGEAAMYLRKSVSWILKQPDIQYLRGVPNTYRRKDLDDWFERHKFRPAA